MLQVGMSFFLSFLLDSSVFLFPVFWSFFYIEKRHIWLTRLQPPSSRLLQSLHHLAQTPGVRGGRRGAQRPPQQAARGGRDRRARGQLQGVRAGPARGRGAQDDGPRRHLVRQRGGHLGRKVRHAPGGGVRQGHGAECQGGVLSGAEVSSLPFFLPSSFQLLGIR